MMRGRWLVVVALAACGSTPEDTAPKPTRAPAATTPATVAPPSAMHVATRRWIPGDLHIHVAPFDVREGASLIVEDLETLGPAAGLEWAIMTPHVHRDTWASPKDRRAWLAQWTTMAREARAATALTLIPGTEFTAFGYGHFGVSGVDLATLGDDALASAAAKGGFVIVNHPFAVPTRIPGIPISERDLSFRPWTNGHGAVPHLDGVEIWNLPLGLANMISRDKGMTGEARAFVAADELARHEHRPIAVVGGSDTHSRVLTPTTWVLAHDASESSILAALRTGATCVGGADAGTLEAHGDAEPPGHWVAIGETTRATAKVELRWSGRARLFIDGKDAGEHDGAFIHDVAAGTHTYRIVIGVSRCGFAYANLAG